MSEIIHRNKVSVEWCGKKFTAVELTVDEVLSVVNTIKQEEIESDPEDGKKPKNKKQEEKKKPLTFQEQIAKIVKIATQGDLELSDITKQAPSKIKDLVIEIEKVNQDFFEIAGWFGIDKPAAKRMIKAIVISNLSRYVTVSAI